MATAESTPQVERAFEPDFGCEAISACTTTSRSAPDDSMSPPAGPTSRPATSGCDKPDIEAGRVGPAVAAVGAAVGVVVVVAGAVVGVGAVVAGAHHRRHHHHLWPAFLAHGPAAGRIEVHT
jgi:hypothetical protein